MLLAAIHISYIIFELNWDKIVKFLLINKVSETL